jgi:hypothetical protein
MIAIYIYIYKAGFEVDEDGDKSLIWPIVVRVIGFVNLYILLERCMDDADLNIANTGLEIQDIRE